MGRKTVKKLLAILMIITILTADFLVLGSNLITYAAQISSETSNSNIEFSAYFKNEFGERVDSIEESIKNHDLKLFAEIAVKNEGYFNGTIKIQNSNFNIKNEILSSGITTIEGNEIKLKQLNSGETVEIELGIEPIISDKIAVDMLSKTSTVILNGKYVYSKEEEGEDIRAEKTVCVNYQPDETVEAELETSIITNKIYSVNSTNKRIVQIAIKSRLSENQYPVQQTTLKLQIPQLGENAPETSVLALGKLATNGTTKIDSIVNENGILSITLKNEVDTNGQINWENNKYDELVVTLIYEANVDASIVESRVYSEIKTYNTEEIYTATKTNKIENQELNNVVIIKTENLTKEMYKGKLYANLTSTQKENIQYETKTTIGITNPSVADKLTINEEIDLFATDNGDTVSSNAKYIQTKINKEKMLQILGNSGTVEIVDGETSTTIDANSEADQNGDVVINYEKPSSKLTIITTKPETTGLLEINHVKDVTENALTRTELKNATTIKSVSTVSATLTEAKIVEIATETRLKLKETTSKAELTVNRENLSTTKANELTLGIKLLTYGEQYDLYKNPTIRIQLPSAVESVSLIGTPSKVYADEFKISSNYDAQSKLIEINLEGEQTDYSILSATQAYFQLNLNVTLSKLAASQEDVITMTYTNENASQYAGGTTSSGVVEKIIGISAPTGLIKMFDLSLNEDKSTTETIKQQITAEQAGSDVSFEIALVNNTDADMNDVKVLGKLPTTGIEGNTLETTLKSITSSKGTIYYTENVDATADIADTSNGWTTNLLTNAKLYLINLDTLSKGDNCTATVNIHLPETIQEKAESYAQYEVIYDQGTEASRKIGLVTYAVSDIDIKLMAQVGQELLNDGDVVNEGEVITYIMKVMNNSSQSLENIEINAGVPEGTTVVKPAENYEYLLNSYYEEKTDLQEIFKTITTLSAGETYTAQYSVRVNTNINSGTEITNEVKATYNGITTESPEITNELQEANIRVTMKKAIDESIKLTAGSEVQYNVIIENISNEAMSGLGIEIISENFIQEGEKLSLGEIPANGAINLKLKGKVKDDAQDLQISANVINFSNKYRSNVVIEKLLNTDASITLTSPQKDANLREGDIVEYNINIVNTGSISEYFKVYYAISKDLAIESVNVTTATATYSSLNSNLIYEGINLEPGQSAQIDIIAKVKNVEQSKVITSKALVEVLNVYKDISQEITHTVLPSEELEETKNIISGSTWLDANGNGQKDTGESALEGINVRIYNVATNKYLDDNKGIIKTTTDSNGEYTFTKIPNGSYIIVFEYDMEKYEPTTYLAEGVDTTVNSKAILKNITVKGEIITVAGTETINLQDNLKNINIGLKEKTSEPSIEDRKKTITGHAWLDANKNGAKDDEEKAMPAIKVKLYNVSTSDYLKDNNGNIVETTTNNNGEYYFTNIEKGSYIIIFEYDTEKYELTTYLADGVDTAKASKAIMKKMIINGTELNVASTDLIELQDNLSNINIGLKELEANAESKNIVSGYAWLDANRNGKKDVEETVLQGIKVKLYSVSTKNYLKDENGNIVETTSDANGKYAFKNVEKGEYILVFEYNTEKYEPTTYLADGVDTTVSSKVVLNKINIDGQEIIAAVTDKINVQTNIFDINIGLKEKLIYDLELSKYISRVVVQNSKETKAYDYENKTLAKVEIHRKRIQGSLVVLEYTIKIKNNGEIAGYAKNIVDYLPQGLTFSSELNTDWYLSENNLHTKSLENVELKPGEEKEIKLILTKTMTGENTGLVNNSAEIYQDYNKYGEVDRDSTPNNKAQSEDDYGSADVVILVATGGSILTYIILAIINIVLIGIAINLMIKNNIIKISTKEERR